MAVLTENKTRLDGWMLPEEAFRAIDGLIKPGDTILELGSGEGTDILLEKYVVHSVEHDPKWMGTFPKEKHTAIYAELDNGWYRRTTLELLLPESYDLLIVDGPVGSENRIKFLENFDLFRVDVPILIDDVHRALEMEMATALAINIPYDMEVVETESNSSFAVLRPA